MKRMCIPAVVGWRALEMSVGVVQVVCIFADFLSASQLLREGMEISCEFVYDSSFSFIFYSSSIW